MVAFCRISDHFLPVLFLRGRLQEGHAAGRHQ